MGNWKITALLATVCGVAAVGVAFFVADSNGRVIALAAAAITLALLSLAE